MKITQLLQRTVGAGTCMLLLLGTAGGAVAEETSSQQQLSEPVYRVPRDENQATVQPQEHPLAPALRMAQQGLTSIDEGIRDYSCTLVKRERIDGALSEPAYIFTKVRHEPFSVYMYFLGPQDVKGRECIYVADQNEGQLIAHEGGGVIGRLGTFHLDPQGRLAMRGQRYPITEVGIRNLTNRLIEVAEHDMKFGECEVKFFKGAKIDGRSATCIQVTHPTPRKEFRFHMARIYVDDELQIPIRYEAYQWPSAPGGKPVLDEEYTYVNMKVNNGFTDADFDESNQNYQFK
ncbi:MAG: DUF1571 domain-containing protein [Pirellulales bacterium]